MKQLLFFLLLLPFAGFAQQIITQYKPPKADSVQAGPDTWLPYFPQGHTLILPETGDVRGIMVSLDDRPFSLEKARPESLIHPAAIKKQWAVLYLATGVPVDLFFEQSSMECVDTSLQQLLQKHKLENKPIALFGSMVSGHRALKYTEYAKATDSPVASQIRGVVLSESPLDWVRMWYEGKKQVRDSLNSVKHFEGTLISTFFEQQFGERAPENMERYADFSPYTYFTTDLSKQQLYQQLAMRAYTFAPANYWYSANGTGIYDCNFPDMQGIINEQKLLGNSRAELIVFTNEKRRPSTKMEVQSNTWNLIDKEELMDWIIRTCRQDY